MRCISRESLLRTLKTMGHCSAKGSGSIPWTHSSSSWLWRKSSIFESRVTMSAGRRSHPSPPWRHSSRGVSSPRGGRMPGDEPYPRAHDTVAVTGLGAVSPFGWSLADLWKGLRAGVSVVGPFDRFDHSAHRTHIAAQVDMTAEPARTRGKASRLSNTDRFAVAAAREAAAQARLDLSCNPHRAGVYFGTSTGGMIEAEQYFEALLAAGIKGESSSLRSLASQPQNGPGDAAARALGVAGPVQTVSAACASAAMAIGDALRAVRSGEVDVAIAGGSD